MSKLKKYLIEQKEKQNLTDKELTERSGIDKGNLSKLLYKDKPFTIDTLERINGALELPIRSLYDLFIEDLIHQENGYTLYKKIQQLILHLCKLNLSDLALTLAESMKGKKNTDSLYFYELAEKLLREEKDDDALTMYELAASLEENHASHMFALCKFKRFNILRDRDYQQVYDVAIEFSLFVEFLQTATHEDLIFKLEAYRKLIATLYEIEKFDAMYKFCDILSRISWNEEIPTGEMDLLTKDRVIYYGYGLVYKGFAARSLKDYSYALQIIDEYEKINIDIFQKWAIMNRLFVQIDSGDISRIPALLDYVKTQPDVKNSAITLALSAYMARDMVNEAAEIIETYQDLIGKAISSSDLFYQKWTVDLHLALARFYFLTVRKDLARSHLLDGIRSTIKLRQNKKWLRCIQEYNLYLSGLFPNDKEYIYLLTEAQQLFY